MSFFRLFNCPGVRYTWKSCSHEEPYKISFERLLSTIFYYFYYWNSLKIHCNKFWQKIRNRIVYMDENHGLSLLSHNQRVEDRFLSTKFDYTRAGKILRGLLPKMPSRKSFYIFAWKNGFGCGLVLAMKKKRKQIRKREGDPSHEMH